MIMTGISLQARKAEEQEQQLMREKELKEAMIAKKRGEKRLAREVTSFLASYELIHVLLLFCLFPPERS